MPKHDPEPGRIRRRLAANLTSFRRQMAGVGEDEVLEALRESSPSNDPRPTSGAERRGSASTRTPSPRE